MSSRTEHTARNKDKRYSQMISNDKSQSNKAKLAMSFVIASLLTAQVSPVFAQYAMSAADDSMLPPEVVPLDPNVAQKLAQTQAQARDMADLNVAGTPQNNQSISSASQTRQNMMDSLMNQGNFQNDFGAPSQNDAPGMVSQGNAGTSDWIMPGQQGGASSMTAYGNVQQTQTLSAPSPNPPVRRDIGRAGLSTAISALAGFGAGAVLGSTLRRPNTMMGVGMTSLMMTGISRGLFRR